MKVTLNPNELLKDRRHTDVAGPIEVTVGDPRGTTFRLSQEGSTLRITVTDGRVGILPESSHTIILVRTFV